MPSPVPPPLPPSAAPPAEVPPSPRKIAVLLGPGGAKSFAHVGVLRALQQQRIPIDKVVGLEWGALIGALFANKGQAHDLEWKLYKLEQQNLLGAKGFFSRRSDETVKAFDGFFADAFGRDDIHRAKIPFSCPAASLWTGMVAWQNRGAFKDALKRCLGFPPVFRIQGSFIAAPSLAADAVDQLAKEGYDLVIFVNVLGSAMPVAQAELMDNVNQVILWQEVKRALAGASIKPAVETVQVDTSAYPILQFEAKKELVQLGEAAGRAFAGTLINKYGF